MRNLIKLWKRQGGNGEFNGEENNNTSRITNWYKRIPWVCNLNKPERTRYTNSMWGNKQVKGPWPDHFFDPPNLPQFGVPKLGIYEEIIKNVLKK